MPFAVAASGFAGIIVVHWAFWDHTPVDWGLSLKHTALSGLVAAGIAAGRWAWDRRVQPPGR
jgi:hypothetical protein